jgi:hypothetical protein
LPCEDPYTESLDFVWSSFYYSEIVPLEEKLGVKVLFDSDDFTKLFKADLEQNCNNYIPKAQAFHLYRHYINLAIAYYRKSFDFEMNNMNYRLDFEGRTAETKTFDLILDTMLGKVSAVYEMDVGITHLGNEDYYANIKFYVSYF